MTALRERGLNRDGCIPIGACAFGAEGLMAPVLTHGPRVVAADAAGALWTRPAGVRGDGPLGRRFLRGLSLTRPFRPRGVWWAALWTRPAGVRVQRVQKVLKFDSGFAAEGCGGRLRRQYE